MCVLCAEIITTLHWSDAPQTDTRGRRRARHQKIKLANRLLRFYGLKLSEWGGRFLLENLKGNQEIVQDLGDLWHKAQKLTNKSLDILDPRLLNFLRENPHQYS